MMIFEKARENARALEQMGEMAIAQAHAAGVAAYYGEPEFPEGIVKHMPDGRRFLIRREAGKEVIIRDLGFDGEQR